MQHQIIRLYKQMILAVGLGNPGKQYSNTRHNIGFIVIDYLIDRYKFSQDFKKKFNSIIAIGNIPNAINKNMMYEKLILAKPQTFMNLSGEAVQAIAHYYRIPTNKIIVIHDDADLPLGKIKSKFAGSHAGHNGLRSLDQYLGTTHYHRIRIGIGKHSHMELSDYVLGEFTNEELLTITASIEKIADNMTLFYNRDIAQFQKAISS